MAELDFRTIDELIHARLRLCAVKALSEAEELEFAALRDRLGATDGNLITHLRKLENGGYVRARRDQRRTLYRLTPAGRRSWRRYRRTMSALLQS